MVACMDESCGDSQILCFCSLPPSLPLLSPPVSTTSAQTPTDSSQDSCSSVYSYVQSRPSCYIYDYDYDTHEEGCSAFYCSWNSSFIDVNVEECQDPVSVAVLYARYGGDYTSEDYDYSDYVEFQYVYNQSETVDNYAWGDTGKYSGILARNASHLGFGVSHCIASYPGGYELGYVRVLQLNGMGVQTMWWGGGLFCWFGLSRA